jgi:hypothetical protein
MKKVKQELDEADVLSYDSQTISFNRCKQKYIEEGRIPKEVAVDS